MSRVIDRNLSEIVRVVYFRATGYLKLESQSNETALHDWSRKSGKRGRGGGQRRTREEGSKNEFGSQDRQDVPNSRERIVKKWRNWFRGVYCREKMNGP